MKDLPYLTQNVACGFFVLQCKLSGVNTQIMCGLKYNLEYDHGTLFKVGMLSKAMCGLIQVTCLVL